MPNMQETEVTIHVTNVVHAQQQIGWFCPEDTYLLAGTLGDQKPLLAGYSWVGLLWC